MATTHLEAAATAIAAKLKTLPDITEMFPYIRPLSLLENGEGFITATGFTLPQTMGPDSFQQVTWTGVVRFQSALTDSDVGEDLERKITNLCSADPSKGVIGILRSASEDIDEQHGYPRVTENGVDVDHDIEADEDLISTIQFQILAQVKTSVVV